MGILVDIFEEERRHLSEKIGDIPPEKAVRIFPIGRRRVKTLPILSRIIALALASLIYVQPAWATPYWQTVSREIAAKTYTSPRFLYASRPNVNACRPGSLSQRAKDRALTAHNRIRALHGLAPVKYSTLYDRSVQEAALIQAANGYPGHYPSSSSRCYTTIGAEGSRHSNLSASTWNGRGRDDDPAKEMIEWTNDAFNRALVAAAGHRRWVLDPFTTYMSYGQVDGHAVQRTKDFDLEPSMTSFITVDYVAFPYRTYPAVFMEDDPPWSFSVVENKTDRWKNKHPYFQLATVTVTRVSDGTRMPVGKLYMDTKGYGIPNFLSWQVKGWEYDTPYQITIRNVAMQTKRLRSYSYRVVIDRGGKQPPTRAVRMTPVPQPTSKRRPTVSGEAREREARAAARAKKRLEQATRR